MAITLYTMNVHQGAAAPVSVTVPEVSALPSSQHITSSYVVLDANVGVYTAGLYYFTGSHWIQLLPYSVLESTSFETYGIDVYFNVQSPVTPASGVVIYKNGALFGGGTIDTTVGANWVTLSPVFSSLTNLGTLASQNANAVAITGGTISGATISSATSVSSAGSIDVTTAGSGLKVAEGANAKQGTATLTTGTVIVANTSVTATSRIFLTTNMSSGTPGFLYISSRIPGTSFTITSSSTTDTSTVAYEIFEQG